LDGSEFPELGGSEFPELTASRSDEVVEAQRILASAYFTHGEYKRALAQVDAILALKEK
jgi:hypothetical protein